MKQTDQPDRQGQRSPLKKLRGEPNTRRVSSPAIPSRAAPAPPTPLDGSRKAPPTPLMLSPKAAWRRFGKETGSIMPLDNFYRWIRNLEISSIRMGRRIFVPITALDDLIRRILTGEKRYKFRKRAPRGSAPQRAGFLDTFERSMLI